MKNHSKGPAYHLINLYRETIHDPEESHPLQNTKENALLAMDYFDVLTVKTFDPQEDDFRGFLGMDADETLTENDVAIQSIPIYCPAMDGEIKEYTNNSSFGDPFTNNSHKEGAGNTDNSSDTSSMPYLGIIQVYLTPEIMAHYKCQDGNNRSINESCFLDLHMLLDEFVEKIRKKSEESGKKSGIQIEYKIYQSLSVGDFIVAIRSSRADIPFYAASAIRRRKVKILFSESGDPVCGGEGSNGDNDNEGIDHLILYKTYTLLSLETTIIHTEDKESKENKNSVDYEAGKDSDSKFVLRCILSNKFWNEETRIENEAPGIWKYLSNQSDNACWRLNGRYDMTIELTEQEFLKIHPLLILYKLDRNDKSDQNTSSTASTQPDDGTKTYDICGFIEYLVRQKYISHINERYIFKSRLLDYEPIRINSIICMSRKNGKYRFLNEINNEKIRTLQGRIRKITRSLLRLDTSRYSILYNSKLLARLTNTCSSINGIADSRIYCAIIIYAIDMILRGLEEYLILIEGKTIKIEGESEIKVVPDQSSSGVTVEEYAEYVTAIDNDLKQALEYLNSFSQYVLESSLQTNQAPNYNLETHISVERLLVAYSSFMNCLLKWYGKTKFSEKTGGMKTNYEALMVPQSLNSELSTCALFNWKDNKYKNNRKLSFSRILVVQCPSFYDLTDFPGTIGKLLHEVGHYFRYEQRKERNDFIREYTDSLLLDLAGQMVVENYRNKIPGFSDYNEHKELVIDCMAKSYKDCRMELNSETDESSLSHLKSAIKAQYQKILSTRRLMNQLKSYLGVLYRDGITEKDGIQKESDLNPEQREQAKEILGKAEKLRRMLENENCGSKTGVGFSELFINLYKVLRKFIDNEDGLQVRLSDVCYQLYDFMEDLFEEQYPAAPGEGSDQNDLMDPDTVNKKVLREFFSRWLAINDFNEKVNDKYTKIIMDKRGSSSDYRRIASYLNLGTYASIGGYQRELSDYIWEYAEISETQALKLIDDMIDLYLETIADLFMVRVLGLTPFGYFNFFSKYVNSDIRFKETYTRRFCMVLFIMQGKNPLLKDGTGFIKKWKDTWSKIYISICEYIIYIVHKSTSVICKEKEDDAGEAVKIMKRYRNFGKYLEDNYKNNAEYEKTHGFLGEVAKYLGDFQNAFLDLVSSDQMNKEMTGRKQEMFIVEINQCRYMCINYMELYYSSRKEIISTMRHKSLVDDLARGAEAFKELESELKRDKMENRSPYKELWNYCKWAGKQFNETGLTEDARSKSYSVPADFIIDMHYRMLVESAERIIDSE